MAATLVLSGLAFQVCFGIIGFGRGGGRRNQDGAALYAAGKTWVAGANPYAHENLLQSVRGTGINLTDVFFFYPPQSAALVVPLAPFDYSTAQLIWLTVNLIAIAAILVLMVSKCRTGFNFHGYVAFNSAVPWIPHLQHTSSGQDRLHLSRSLRRMGLGSSVDGKGGFWQACV